MGTYIHGVLVFDEYLYSQEYGKAYLTKAVESCGT